jgi:LuxR family maltose regulon positive regulatory protein
VCLAAPEHYDRAFLDEGAPIAALLPAVRASAPSFVDHLIDEFRSELAWPQGDHTPQPLLTTQRLPADLTALVDPVSARERDVLHLLAEGLTYAQIAARLVVSLNTVRSHVKNLYGKLGVHHRTQAIAMAREIRLLQ